MALPSPTVENYLKAIFQAQLHLERRTGLVPMGQLAAALGVVPGTATTMVKTLADSGLAKYEPYAGVRLTPSGEKLAALVVRRHRLIELFLVKVMGMSWTEVHDEAELLEHAVSDRLIERIDEMLGRPEADPHGDPIPDAEGVLERRPFDTLLTCPLNAPVTVRRVTDQDPEFLHFVERRDLKPGETVEVIERDAAADSVRVRGRKERAITIGARAASKVLVQLATVATIVLAFAAAGFAQTVAPQPAAQPFQILDNSFFVEEAFNQERGIFQNIFGMRHEGGDWQLTFTQEWPAPAQRHQLSYTVAAESVGSKSGFGDVYLNYRFQALEEAGGHPAFSPRVSVIVPSGRQSTGAGEGGLQVNLPFSKQHGDVYFHWNGGFTWLPRGERVDLVSPTLAGSAIYRLRPMLNLMLESVLAFDADETSPGIVERTRAFTLSPGVRGGWNVAKDTQLVLGAALPITRVSGDASVGVFGYVSYELPFVK
ncbi:MAG TPA: metal-dependent transcriptional regulator [Vicinamibacterales bacterium]|nr:metal-dependent transcriptional regulator [Vicinamibacterales bacterium]